jgi:putative ABC transport system substrate-binding protein
MRRRDFITLLGGAAAASPLAARAQQNDRVRRVGVLFGGVLQPIAAFRERLAMLGWVEGRNLRMDSRSADLDPDRIAAYAEELVNLQPDVIFAFNGPAAQAVQQRTAAIPIVFAGGGDPASNDLVGNIARPGGNMTGFAGVLGSLGGKWLELFKEAVPGLTRVAHVVSAISRDADPRNEIPTTMDAAAGRLGVTIVRMRVQDTAEIKPAIGAFAAAPHGGLLATGVASRAHYEAITRLALHYRLPLMARVVAEGVLMSYSPDPLDGVRGAASYVDRILRGAKPSELPVQFPSKFKLVVNLKTAKALGIEVPTNLLLLADEVIE